MPEHHFPAIINSPALPELRRELGLAEGYAASALGLERTNRLTAGASSAGGGAG
jgi:hypothetical protein